MTLAYPSKASRLRKILFFLLSAGAAAVAYSAYADVLELGLIDRVEAFRAGADIDVPTLESDLDINAGRQLQATLVYLGAMLATWVVLLMWVYRANRSCRELGDELQFTPGWAVGYWFIPVLNLFRPYQIVAELWQRATKRSGTQLVAAWWFCWLGSGWLGRIADHYYESAGDSLTQLETALKLVLVSDALDLVALGLTAMVVSRITAGLLARAESAQVAPARVMSDAES